MIFELAEDFSEALGSMPRGCVRWKTIQLVEESILRDVEFIERHPTTLFQCMWNTCWWFDCALVSEFFEQKRTPWQRIQSLVSKRPRHDLSAWMEKWRALRQEVCDLLPEYWVFSFLPPVTPLGVGMHMTFKLEASKVLPLQNTTYLLALQEVFNPIVGRILLIDPSTGNIVTSNTIKDAHPSCAIQLPNTTLVATGWADGSVRIFDYEASQFGHSFDMGGRVSCLGICPQSGNVLAVGDHLTEIDVREWRMSAQLELTVGVCCMAICPDGSKAVFGCGDGNLRIFERQVDTWREIRNQRAHGIYYWSDNRRILNKTTIRDVGYCSNEQWIWSAGDDGGIYIWDAVDLSEVKRLCLPLYEGYTCRASVSPDGERIAVLDQKKARLLTFDVATGKLLGQVIAHEYEPTSLHWNHENTNLITIGRREIRFWDSQTLGIQRIADIYKDVSPFLTVGSGLPNLEKSAEWWSVQAPRINMAAGPCAIELSGNFWGDDETTITLANTKQTAGWFPAALDDAISHPGRAFAAGKRSPGNNFPYGLVLLSDRNLTEFDLLAREYSRKIGFSLFSWYVLTVLFYLFQDGEMADRVIVSSVYGSALAYLVLAIAVWTLVKPGMTSTKEKYIVAMSIGLAPLLTVFLGFICHGVAFALAALVIEETNFDVHLAVSKGTVAFPVLLILILVTFLRYTQDRTLRRGRLIALLTLTILSPKIVWAWLWPLCLIAVSLILFALGTGRQRWVVRVLRAVERLGL